MLYWTNRLQTYELQNVTNTKHKIDCTVHFMRYRQVGKLYLVQKLFSARLILKRLQIFRCFGLLLEEVLVRQLSMETQAFGLILHKMTADAGQSVVSFEGERIRQG